MEQYYHLLTPEVESEFNLLPNIIDNYRWIKSNPKDQKGKNSIQWIAHYMEVLKHYSDKDSISVEFGLNQANSTWALLASKATQIHSVDIDVHKNPIKHLQVDKNIWAIHAHELASQEGKQYQIHECSSLDIQFKSIDFLFIDSLHTADHLKAELDKHSSIVQNYIAIHDTQLFKKSYGTTIEDFLNEGIWEVEREFIDDPGLLILKRADK